MKWYVIVCLGLIDLMRMTNGVAEDALLNQCSELKAQEHLDLNEVMGKWYVVEVIEHKKEGRQNVDISTISTTRVVLDACPIVTLRPIETHSGGPRRMSMLWEENAGSLEYTFWVSNNRGPGVWNSDIIQNGTMADSVVYNQFIGTVHVIKAVASHAVLTFCSRNIDGQKFTILMGRDYKLPKTDSRSVHKLLDRRNLPLLHIRESCTQGSASTSYAHASFLVFGFLMTRAWSNFRKVID